MEKGNKVPDTVLHQLRKKRQEEMGKSEWTQAAIARKIGVTTKSYRSWERGERSPDTIQVISLASLFGVSTDFILGISTYTNVGNKEVMEITGLSEESVNTLRLLNARGNRPGERGAYIDGIQIEELSLLDDVITSNRFHSLFNAVSAYLIYGMANTKVPLPNMPQEEYETMRKWLLDRGLVISSKRNICDMYLQNAADELKAIFKEVLESKKEDAQNG